MEKKDERLLEFFSEFLVATRGLSRATVMAYTRDIKSLIDYACTLGGGVESITKAQVEHFLKSCTLKSSSIARRASAYRQFYQFLVSEKIIATSPVTDIQTTKADTASPMALSSRDLEKLLSTARASGTKLGIRTAAMLELLYSTGMRVSEMLSIRLADISDYETGRVLPHITVMGKGGKERLVIISDDAQRALHRYLDAWRGIESAWLFPGKRRASHVDAPMTRQRFFGLCKDAALCSGLNPGIFSPHVMRHSFATQLVRNGMDIRIVQELLGHSSIASTQIYTTLNARELYNLVKRHHPINNAPD